MIETMLLLGASGDLTGRLLLPAIARLRAVDRLPEGFRIIGFDRNAWDDETFRAHARERLERFAGSVDPAAREQLVAGMTYAAGDVTAPADLRAALDSLDRARTEPVVVYLALPNVLFVDTLTALGKVGLPPGSMAVVEKPYGRDLADARRLNEIVHGVVGEDGVFRIDHFLAKQTVLNLLGLRFANRIFEPVWNSGHVERVDIVIDEALGLEGRSSYYDRAGALRDMLQNHLLQLLSLVAMEPPASMSGRDLRDRKVDLLRSVRPPSREQMAALTARGRYTAGRIGERDFPSYVDEPGVDPDRETETYAEVTLFVDNWRWAGVPFRLRSGKALGERRREIRVTFRPVPHLTFGPDQSPSPNLLRMTLDPDRIELDVDINGPGDPFDLERVPLELTLPAHELPPYSLLLLEVLDADGTLSIRGDEAEESWRIVEPVLAAWQAGEVPLEDYPAGSPGPRPAFPATVDEPKPMPVSAAAEPG